MPKLYSLKLIKNSNVFLKVDFDVPINKGKVQSYYRVDRCLNTINLLIKNNNQVCIFTKIGRPSGFNKNLSTKILLPYLRKKLNAKVGFANNTDSLKETLNKVTLFENTRFYNWEDDPTSKEIKSIASYFKYFVDESFATSHRTEASNFYIAKEIGRVSVGLNYLEEIKTLKNFREGNFKNPSVFILGGAKADTKLPMVKRIVKNFTQILIGGKLATEDLTKDYSKKYKNINILLPNASGFDINSTGLKDLYKSLKSVNTVCWNGPTGMFEDPIHSKSTKATIKLLSKSKAYKLAGGGDTISAIQKFGSFKDYNFVSTGGGAMFSFLGKNKTNIEKLLN